MHQYTANVCKIVILVVFFTSSIADEARANMITTLVGTLQITSTSRLFDRPHHFAEVSEVGTEYVSSGVRHLNELRHSVPRTEAESQNTYASVSEVT